MIYGTWQVGLENCANLRKISSETPDLDFADVDLQFQSRTSRIQFWAPGFASIRVLKSCCLDCRLHCNESSTEYINTDQYPKDLKSFRTRTTTSWRGIARNRTTTLKFETLQFGQHEKSLKTTMGPHEPSKQFQNLLDIYSVVSRELTTLWFRNLDINYKRSQNIGWNEHKS